MKTGVTLLEVLIAILVASVGLLGAIAVFPVALAQARKGELADMTAVAGESAISSFQVQGMHETARWLYWDAANNSTAQVPTDFNRSLSSFFGHAFCIDPLLFAHNAADDPANAAVWAHFPAVPATAAAVRMDRLTLTAGNPSAPLQAMSQLFADKAFRIEDELMYERPDDGSLPSAQLFTPMDNGPGRRQEEGRLTWFATLVPKIDRMPQTDVNGVAMLGSEYVLSIVVCRNRASGEGLHVNDPASPSHPWNEWTAKILQPDFHAGGAGGGEVTVTTNDPAADATFNKEEYLQLKSGQWVMLGRTLSGQSGPIQHFQWYRVSDAGEAIANGSRWSQDVSLIGGDWPADADCDVTIMPSVVHVYERTVRLVQ